MNGYELIKGLSIKEIMNAFQIERGQAYFISQKGIEGLIKDPYVCPLALPLLKKHICTFHEEGCHECMKRFLMEEIYYRTEGSPCTRCIERDFCQGMFPCRKYKEYERKQNE